MEWENFFPESQIFWRPNAAENSSCDPRYLFMVSDTEETIRRNTWPETKIFLEKKWVCSFVML